MREGPDVLINALAGERVVFRTHAADTGGELIQFDLVLTKVGGSPPAHVHLHQSERFSVRSGAIKVTIAGEDRVLRQGDEALVPAGTPHRWWNAGPGDALVSVEMRPASTSRSCSRKPSSWWTRASSVKTAPSTRRPPTPGPTSGTRSTAWPDAQGHSLPLGYG